MGKVFSIIALISAIFGLVFTLALVIDLELIMYRIDIAVVFLFIPTIAVLLGGLGIKGNSRRLAITSLVLGIICSLVTIFGAFVVFPNLPGIWRTWSP
ncbi:MAG TPA: hypothetical protein ENI29_17920 [bacterium]|nr:hypothetical protein [bacterium]